MFGTRFVIYFINTNSVCYNKIIYINKKTLIFKYQRYFLQIGLVIIVKTPVLSTTWSYWFICEPPQTQFSLKKTKNKLWKLTKIDQKIKSELKMTLGGPKMWILALLILPPLKFSWNFRDDFRLIIYGLQSLFFANFNLEVFLGSKTKTRSEIFSNMI